MFNDVTFISLQYLNIIDILIIMALLFTAGVERNPGPSFDSSSSSTTSTPSFDETLIKNKFSIVHYNVQSIANKID